VSVPGGREARLNRVKNIFTICLALYLLINPIAHGASSIADQLLGIRLAQTVSQNILASPPLPSLVENTKSGIKPAGSYLTLKMEGKEKYDEAYPPLRFGGKGKGWSAGLGITEHTKQKLSFFGFGIMSSTKSTMVLNHENSNAGFYLHNIKSIGYNLMGGLSYRFWTRKTFPIVLGALGGPFFSYFRSEFKTSNSPIYEEGNEFETETYSSSTLVFGPMVGAQLFLSIWGMEINPFILRYMDVSSTCEAYKTTAENDTGNSQANNKCKKPRQIELDGTFTGYGLNLGLFGLSFGAYSKITPHTSTAGSSSIKVSNYSFSYNFVF